MLVLWPFYLKCLYLTTLFPVGLLLHLLLFFVLVMSVNSTVFSCIHCSFFVESPWWTFVKTSIFPQPENFDTRWITYFGLGFDTFFSFRCMFVFDRLSCSFLRYFALTLVHLDFPFITTWKLFHRKIYKTWKAGNLEFEKETGWIRRNFCNQLYRLHILYRKIKWRNFLSKKFYNGLTCHAFFLAFIFAHLDCEKPFLVTFFSTANKNFDFRKATENFPKNFLSRSCFLFLHVVHYDFKHASN